MIGSGAPERGTRSPFAPWRGGVWAALSDIRVLHALALADGVKGQYHKASRYLRSNTQRHSVSKRQTVAGKFAADCQFTTHFMI